MTPMDPRVRARLLGMPGGSPLSMYTPEPPLSSPVTPLTGPPSPVTPPAGPPSPVDSALQSFDAHQARRAAGTPAPASTARQPIDTRNVRGDYFDDELPPALEPKEPAPIEEKKKPSKFWRILDAIGGGMSGRGYHAGYWQSVDAQNEREGKEALLKQKQAQLANPGSKESRAAQSKWRSYLKAAGWSDDEVSRMTAAELADMSLADVSKFATTAAQKQAELAERTKAEQAKLAETRAYNEAQDEKKRAANDATWTAHNEVTSSQALERVNVLARNRAEAARIAADREDAKLEGTRLRDYENKLIESGVTATQTILNRARRNIEAAKKKNGGEIFTGADEALRRGPKMGWSAMSDEGKAVMEDLQKVQNAEIKDQNGAAVSVHEMARTAGAQGTDLLSNEADLERYLSRVDEGLEAVRQGYQRAYQQRPARTSSDEPAPARTGGGGGAAPKPGRTGKLRLPDGTQAADTPGNRAKLAERGVKFEVL